jgi:hypothetical protein
MPSQTERQPASPPPGRPPDSRRAWIILVAVGLLLTAIILVMVAHRAESSSDFRDFWKTAQHYRLTGELSVPEDLEQREGVHNYLPFFTIFMTPWTLLPLHVAAVGFVLLSLVLFGLTAGLAELTLADGTLTKPRPAFIASLALAFPYVYACAVVGNLALLLLFLIISAWLLVERGRDWQAGVMIGLATLIKLLPGLLIVYFLLKRRWLVAATAAAVIITLGLGLPVAAVGPKQAIAEHAAFFKRTVAGQSAVVAITAEKPPKFNYSNNALPIVLRRLLSPQPAAHDQDLNPLLVNIANLPRTAILVLYASTMTAILALSILATLRKPHPWPPESLNDTRRVRGQFGLWCCLMLIGSPLVWTHYLPLVYWPLAVAADRAERAHRATRATCRWSSTALLTWAAGAILLAWPAARAAGAQLASILALWLAMLALQFRRWD